MNVKTIAGIIMALLICGCGLNSPPTALPAVGADNLVSNTPPDKKISISIVYDASGSMAETVLNTQGQPEKKFEVANRAMWSIAKILDNYLATDTNKIIFLSIIVLRDGQTWIDSNAVLNSNSRLSSTFFNSWLKSPPKVSGGTALGNAVNLAAVQSGAYPSINKRHVIVITDGENTNGPDPAPIVAENKSQNALLGFHFIAFDVGANVFNAVKEAGADVAEAFNEQQLVEQLDYILVEKILLERED